MAAEPEAAWWDALWWPEETIRHGDGRHVLTPLGQRLVADNTGLAYQALTNYLRACPWMARHAGALESAALTGLCRAAIQFDPARGWRFSTYAMTACKRAVWTEARDRYEAEDGEVACSQLPWDPFEGRVGEDGPEPDLGEPPAVALARRLLATLPDRLAALLRRRLAGLTLEQAGAGEMCKERARQLEAKAMNRLRQYVRERGLTWEG